MGCFGCLKTILIIFSVGYLLVGLGLLAVSLWLRFDYLKDASDALSMHQPDYMTIALYVAMGIGGFLAILGIMGCVGAMRISLCLLGNFAVLLVAAIGGLIAVCVLAYLYQDVIINGVGNVLSQLMQQYGDPLSKSTMDGLQRAFRCCGSVNPQEWQTRFGQPIPVSCCVDMARCGNLGPYSSNPVPMSTSFVSNAVLGNIPGSGPQQQAAFNPVDTSLIFNVGCWKKLQDNYKDAMKIIIGLSGGIAGFMLLGFIMCVAFCCVM